MENSKSIEIFHLTKKAEGLLNIEIYETRIDRRMIAKEIKVMKVASSKDQRKQYNNLAERFFKKHQGISLMLTTFPLASDIHRIVCTLSKISV